MPKLNYEESVREIKDLQKKIREHQEGVHVLEDYVASLKKLQFLRNSIRALKKQKAHKGKR
jgi:hypothetical protein